MHRITLKFCRQEEEATKSQQNYIPQIEKVENNFYKFPAYYGLIQ